MKVKLISSAILLLPLAGVLSLTYFTRKVSAIFMPSGYVGTIIEKDIENSTFEIQTDYEWSGDKWQPKSATLKWRFPNEDSIDETNVGDYLEIVGLPREPSGWAICLGKMKSSTEKVITDIYGDPNFLEPYFDSLNPDPPLLGDYKIDYCNVPDCSDCDLCFCRAKYTNLTISNGNGQVEVNIEQLHPGENYVYAGKDYCVDIIFHSGRTSTYPCTGTICAGPQPVSDFTIHITGNCGEVRLAGLVATDEEWGNFVCYGSYYCNVTVGEILYDANNTLSLGDVVAICYNESLSLGIGDQIECYGIYHKRSGPLQCIGRVDCRSDPYYVIPEFPSALVLLLLMTSTFVVVVLLRKWDSFHGSHKGGCG